MREIRFRGKRKSSRKEYQYWVYGYLYKDIDGTCQILFNDENGDINFEEVKENTIGQYTNLKDKNGVEIYEGDILHDRYFSWEVYFDDGAFWRRWLYPDLEGDREEEYLGGTTDDLEVIGNIYENKLKEEGK